MSRARWANWKGRYQAEELSQRKPFIITSEINIDKRTVEGIQGGIFSKEIGSPIDTDKDIREFTCECGEKHGKFYEGELCESCNTVVKENIGAEIERVGWFDIHPYEIMVPPAYEMIVKVVGAKNFLKNIDYQANVDIEGISKTQLDPKNPYANIGMIEFRHRFEEIIQHYGTLRGKLQEANFLLNNKDKVFSDKIPVISGLLRPSFASNKKRMFSFDSINKIYAAINTNTNVIKNSMVGRVKTSVLPALFTIQTQLQELYLTIIKTKISGKKKIPRAAILGSRLDFSARFVIVPMVGKYASMDSVEINYKGFMELYKLEIVRMLMLGYGDPTFVNKTVYEILIYIKKAYHSDKFDPMLYGLMKMLIEKRKGGLWVLINRNPSMDLGSVQCVRIVHVTENVHNLTMAIPLTSLKAMNADFDGDVLNVFALKEQSVIDAFRKGLNPRFLLLDRTGDNFFNNSFGLIKDQMTNLSSFVTPLHRN